MYACFNLAYAVLAAYYGLRRGGIFERLNIPASSVLITTVGAPKVGDARFVSLIEGLGLAGLYRLVNGNDIVPRSPVNSKYVQFLGEVYIDPFYKTTPVLCSEQPVLQQSGSCFHRFEPLQLILAGVSSISNSHLIYMGQRINCRYG